MGQSVIEALRATLAPWAAREDLTEVYLCGMAGSRNGLVEVPYCAAPAVRSLTTAGCV